MRPFSIIRHRTSGDIHAAAAHMRERPSLRLIRRVGVWAFVSVPPDVEATCTVHLWHRRDVTPQLLAMVIGHELGHISDGGPWDHELGASEEEERANEFAAVTAATVALLMGEGLLRGRAVRRRSRRRRTS